VLGTRPVLKGLGAVVMLQLLCRSLYSI
jgi:hypothetical protein